MLLSRRRALLGLFAAPAIIKTAGLLMPVRVPPLAINLLPSFEPAPIGFGVLYRDAAGVVATLTGTEREHVIVPAGSTIERAWIWNAAPHLNDPDQMTVTIEHGDRAVTLLR